MTIDFSLNTLIQICTLLGIIFGVYLYFRRPQEDTETRNAVFNERFNNLEGIVLNLRDNHIHTLQEKLEDHVKFESAWQMETSRQIERLNVILEERLPKK